MNDIKKEEVEKLYYQWLNENVCNTSEEKELLDKIDSLIRDNLNNILSEKFLDQIADIIIECCTQSEKNGFVNGFNKATRLIIGRKVEFL